MNCKDEANTAIGCTVNNCKYHCNASNNCTLDRVSIGTHENNPTQCQCVDCESFSLKSE